MRPEVLVAKGLRNVDAASLETGTNQEHRLVVVARHGSPLLAVPRPRDVERRGQMIDLLPLPAPTAILKLRRRKPRSAQVLLHLVTSLFRHPIEDPEELTGERFSVHRR